MKKMLTVSVALDTQKSLFHKKSYFLVTFKKWWELKKLIVLFYVIMY